MKNFLITKLFSLNRKLKLIIIFFLDLLIILCSTYGSLAIRFDQLNLFEIVDERYLITFEFFLIPIISYFTIAIFFKFYSYSFRQYNLGSYIFLLFLSLVCLFYYLILFLMNIFLSGSFNKYYFDFVINNFIKKIYFKNF